MFGQARQQALICQPCRWLLTDQLGTAGLGRATWFIAELVADHGHYAQRRTTQPAVSHHAMPRRVSDADSKQTGRHQFPIALVATGGILQANDVKSRGALTRTSDGLPSLLRLSDPSLFLRVCESRREVRAPQ